MMTSTMFLGNHDVPSNGSYFEDRTAGYSCAPWGLHDGDPGPNP